MSTPGTWRRGDFVQCKDKAYSNLHYKILKFSYINGCIEYIYNWIKLKWKATKNLKIEVKFAKVFEKISEIFLEILDKILRWFDNI